MTSETMTVRALVADAAATAGSRATVLAPDRPDCSGDALLAGVDALGARLRAAGVGRNDRVAIVVPNGPEMAVSFLAVAAYATAAPLNPAYKAADFEFYLADLSARVVIVQAGFDSPVRDVAERMGVPVMELQVDPDAAAGIFQLAGAGAGAASSDGPAEPDDIALVLHTSGTTSRPKIVPLSHRNVCTSAGNIAATLALTPDDRCLNVMPLFHIHGLMAAVLSTVKAAASIVCSPGFDADGFYGWLDRFQPTWYTAVPTMHQSVLAGADRHGEILDRANLRFVRSSSASLPPPVMEALESTFGAPVIEAYGMTEAAHQMASNPLPPSARKPGSVGVAAGPEVAIMDTEGTLLEVGQAGEIVIRGANVTAGYEANPEANAGAFTEGWFRTGDEGVLDDDGYLRITGRLKEMVNRGGEKVIPREIDEALLGHPDVAQAVAFALPHATLGEDLGAAVVLVDGAVATEADLRSYCFDMLAGFKVPSRIVVIDAIPKGATGKLQRIGLHEKLADALAIGFEAPEGELETAVATVWGELLRTDVGRHDNFFSLGGDSLSATSAVARLAAHAAHEIEPADLFRAPTVAGFAALLRGEVAMDDGPLVQLRDGAGRPIFCVPGHGGDPFTFLELAKRLDGDRPIYALEFPPELRSEARDVEVAANRRTNELARDFLAAIRDRQPDGPYDLVGFCFGGFIAHEMIATLEDDGQLVSSAVYINSWQHTAHRYTTFGKVKRHLRDPVRAVRRAIARVQGKPLPGLYAGDFPGQRPISTPLVLVKPVDHLGADETWDHQMGWDEFATITAVYDIPGAQREVFTAAHVEPLREILDTTVVTSTP